MATLWRHKPLISLFFIIVLSMLSTSSVHSAAFTHSMDHPDDDGVQDPHRTGVLGLDYHFGPVMTGKDDHDVINMFVIYYGNFTDEQTHTLTFFLKSFWQETTSQGLDRTTVSKWWRLTRRYVDLYHKPVASSLNYAGEKFDNYSLGTSLKQSDIQKLVVGSFSTFGADSSSMYLVLTSDDVLVERFGENVCGSHFYTFPSEASNNELVPYAWIGNPGKQCPFRTLFAWVSNPCVMWNPITLQCSLQA